MKKDTPRPDGLNLKMFRLIGAYREFLLDPGTLVTIASGILLIMAMIADPAGILSGSKGNSTAGLLYLLAALTGSSYIWWSAIQGIRESDFTADIPVSVATIAAIAIGEYPAAAIVAVLLLLGGLLEELVSAHANRALEALETLLPGQVTVRREGHDTIVPLEEVLQGDVLLVRSGERIPVDGTVKSGAASVNQAAITGESLPVERKRGDTVFAGTLNEVGVLEIEATKVGKETTIGNIRRLIEDAQAQKPHIERTLDTYAKFYTPLALLLGVILWLWTGNLLRSITVLIVFCPCVMVLATPTALVASIGNAALKGSLIKKGATIEALANIDTVVFDKTGTLTAGRPKLLDIIVMGSTGRNDLLRIAASAEMFSEHPLGRAVVRDAEDEGWEIPDPEDFEVLPGRGVKAVVNGQEVYLGRPDHREQYDRADEDRDNAIALQESLGHTVIAAFIDKKLAGLLVFEDELREESETCIESLSASGLRTIMITGDSNTVGRKVAGKLGIAEFYAQVLPQDKVEIVRRLQSEGRRVAFVGDGVNDGPALAAADVGIAMGLTGTDVAIETAEVGLLSDDLSRIPQLIEVSRKAIRTIKQNVVFSLAVLTIAVILTIPGILTPVTGALLHELSSIPVIMNSARLISYRNK